MGNSSSDRPHFNFFPARFLGICPQTGQNRVKAAEIGAGDDFGVFPPVLPGPHFYVGNSHYFPGGFPFSELHQRMACKM
jgi:hypothetical protein